MLLPVMDCVGEEGGDEDVHAVLVEMVEEVRLLALVHAGCCPRERERERGSRDRDYKQHLIFFVYAQETSIADPDPPKQDT